MQCVILAAGKGTRLRPVTLKRSKAMAPVAGKPIVHRVIDTFRTKGIQEFILVVSPDDMGLQSYFQHNEDLADVDITIVHQHERLGMAHALKLAAPHIHSDFVLSACDNLLPLPFIHELLTTHQTQNALATLALMEVPDEVIPKTGIVDWVAQGDIIRIQGIIEKPAIEDAPSNMGSIPIYVFSHKLLDFLPNVQPSKRGEYELQDAIQMLVEESTEARYVTGVVTGSRSDLTNVSDLLDLNRHYLQTNSEPPHLRAQSIGANTKLIMPVRVDSGVVIGADCEIGPHVYIEADCEIGAGVVLRDAIVLAGSVIEGDREIGDEVVLSL